MLCTHHEQNSSFNQDSTTQHCFSPLFSPFKPDIDFPRVLHIFRSSYHHRSKSNMTYPRRSLHLGEIHEKDIEEDLFINLRGKGKTSFTLQHKHNVFPLTTIPLDEDLISSKDITLNIRTSLASTVERSKHRESILESSFDTVNEVKDEDKCIELECSPRVKLMTDVTEDILLAELNIGNENVNMPAIVCHPSLIEKEEVIKEVSNENDNDNEKMNVNTPDLENDGRFDQMKDIQEDKMLSQICIGSGSNVELTKIDELIKEEEEHGQYGNSDISMKTTQLKVDEVDKNKKYNVHIPAVFSESLEKINEKDE